MHTSDSGYARQANEWEGPSEYSRSPPAPFGFYYGVSRSPMADTLAALACHGTLARFPDSGSHRSRTGATGSATSWSLADMYRRVRDVRRGSGRGDPPEPLAGPFSEDDFTRCPTPPVDHLLFGSDYPATRRASASR